MNAYRPIATGRQPAFKPWFVYLCMLAIFLLVIYQLCTFDNRSLNVYSKFRAVIVGEPEFEIRFKNFRQKYQNFGEPCTAETKIMLLLMTRRNGFDNRKSIRDTWLNDSLSNQTLRFFVADGLKSENASVQMQLDEEQARHGDLVFLHGFVDKYLHINLKLYAAMQWQQTNCPKTEWVLRVDDDVVLHLPRMQYWIDHKFRPFLKSKKTELAIFGWMWNNDRIDSVPVRDNTSQWYTSEAEYPGNKFPRYANGAIYLTTAATMAATLTHSAEVTMMAMDDVMNTGVLAERHNFTLSDQRQHFVVRFNPKEKWDTCEGGSVPATFATWGVQNMKQNAKLYYKAIKELQCRKQ